MEVFAITNQKGGTGKTTTAHAIGTGLKLRGFRVLFVDLDGQGNLSFTLGAAPGQLSITELLQQSIRGQVPDTLRAIQHTDHGDIIPSTAGIANADRLLSEVIGKEYKLREILEPVRDRYDYIIIDTPPTLGVMTVNALTAATKAIVPAQADVYSVTALQQFYATIETLKKYCNPGLVFEGVLLTRYSKRAVLSREIAERIAQDAKVYGTKVFNTPIRECIALKECEILKRDIYSYAPRSNAAADYNSLLDELLGT